jgi:hypothetical protein
MRKQDINTGVNHGDNYCYYYLHVNGELILKEKSYTPRDFDDSDLVKMWWLVDLDNRTDGYHLLIRANMLGAKKECIQKLVTAWKIDDEDCEHYIKAFRMVAKMDGNQWCVHMEDFVNLQTSIAGFGSTKFEALCDFYNTAVGAS